MRLVVIESPYAGDIEANTSYAIACMKDSLERGEAPYASHLLYTQVLNDLEPSERTQGIHAGFEWGARADIVAVYTDRGISGGMKLGIEAAEKRGTPIEYRSIPHDF